MTYKPFKQTNTGVDKDSLKVQTTNGHLLKELLIQQKITNQYQKQIVGDVNEVKESDIEIQ